MHQLKILCLLDRVSDRVPKVQDRTFTLLCRILLNNDLFAGAAFIDHILQDVQISVMYLVHIFNDPLIERGTLDQSMFQHLSHSGIVLSVVKRPERCYIHVHKPGHVERADHILVLVQIHARLSANAAVHLCQEACGNLDKINAPQISGRRISGDISYHPAPKRY